MARAVLLALAVLWCFLMSAPGFAATAADRPRIGLALSGGGARGLAHVGVLKVLEELHVPVDCVAGTSMGAIVGGAYAAGMSGQALEDVVMEMDWKDVFVDRPPRAEMAPRRKREDYAGYFAPEFGARDGSLLLPKGLVAGVSVESFLRRITAGAQDVQQFSQLPIPFRAVAADIETGEAVVLDRGSLPLALRASMAIPGAMAPVEIDGRLLVDGGIVDNLPIDLARRTCADVVIAVNIQTEPMRRQQITSALSIVGQLVNFLGKDAVDRQLRSLGPADVLVQPVLGDISSGSFERAAQAMAMGEQAARTAAQALARYSVPPREYAAWRSRQRTAVHQALPAVDEIRFEGLQRSSPEVLAQLLDTRPGMPLTEEGLARDMRRVYGRGDFDSVDYRIDESPNGRRVLVLRAREKETGPDYVRFGLALASDFEGENHFNALLSYRRTWLNRLGAEWLTEAQLGHRSLLRTEFFQPLQRDGAHFVAPHVQASWVFRPVYLGDARVAQFQYSELAAGVDVGSSLGQWGEVRFGPLWRSVRVRSETGLSFVDEIRTNASGVRLRLFGDRLDAPWFPREGHRFGITLHSALPALGADKHYTRAEASVTGAWQAGRHSIEAMLAGGSGLGTRLPYHEALHLGGPFRLSAFRLDQFAGQRMALARLRYMNRVRELPAPLGAGIYAGLSLEAGRMERLYDGRPGTGALWSSALFLGSDTFLGPAWLGLALGSAGQRSVFLMLGVP